MSREPYWKPFARKLAADYQIDVEAVRYARLHDVRVAGNAGNVHELVVAGHPDFCAAFCWTQAQHDSPTPVLIVVPAVGEVREAADAVALVLGKRRP